MPQLDTFRPEPGTLPTRDAIPRRYKWDLTSICQTWDEWHAAYSKLDEAIAAFPGFQGTLAQGPERLVDAFKAMDAMGALSYRVWYFAALHYDEDQRNNEINARRQQVQILFARQQQASSWFNPELLAIPIETVRAWLDTKRDPAAPNHDWLYFAWERDSNSGSGFIAYEFMKNAAPAACAYDTATDAQLTANCNPWANRTSGDFMILWDQQGGSKDLYLRTWSGTAPNLTLGAPTLLNSAVSEAMIMSHSSASSQPPPSAKPETAAINGVRQAAICCHSGIPCMRASRSQTAASSPPRAILWPRMWAVSGKTSSAVASSLWSTRGAT